MSKEERIQKWQAEKEWLTKYLSRFPQCVGYPDCDGELGHGEPHGTGCPCFGKTDLRRPSIPEILATFAAETKLSEPQAVPESAPEAKGMILETALVELLHWLEEDTLEIMKDTIRMGITFDWEDCQSLRAEITKAESALTSYREKK